VDVTFATEPGGSGPNIDWVGATPHLAVVLDGLTVPNGLDTGCRHGPPWYVRQLGHQILAQIDGRERQLREGLAGAIDAVSGLHAGTCDLTNPATPSATVAIVRERAETVDVLVLADAVVVLDEVGRPARALVDRRVDDVASVEGNRARAAEEGSAEHQAATRALVAAQLAYRNQPGGYWIAGAQPDAAGYALTETAPRTALRRAVLLSDGASRFTDLFRIGSWDDLLDKLAVDGPRGLLDRVRQAERGDPAGFGTPRFKRHDDATVALCRWPS